jgi:hypothetical protein
MSAVFGFESNSDSGDKNKKQTKTAMYILSGRWAVVDLLHAAGKHGAYDGSSVDPERDHHL